MSWAALPPALLLIALAYGARRWFGSWVAPGAFFALTWVVLVWAALIIAPDFRVWPVAIWSIAVGVLCVGSGHLIGASFLAGLPSAEAPPPPTTTGLPRLSLLGAGAGLLGVLVLLRSLGQSPALFLAPSDLGALAARVSSARYEEGYVEPFVTRLLMTGTYLSVLVGGTLVGLDVVRGRRPAVWGGFIPAIAMSAVTTTRATVLFCLVLWVGGYLAGALHRRNDFRRLLTRRSLLVGGVGLPLLVIGAGAIQLSRYGMGIDGALYVADRIRIWIVGFLAGYATWLDQGSVADLGTGAGAYTLAGAYNLAGITTRSLGIFTDRVMIADGYEVNIYTIFRSVLEDFGVLGGAMALVVFGAVGGASYAGVARGRTGWLPILALVYALTLFSHITSLLNYNSIVLAWVAFALALPASRIYAALGPSDL